MQRAAPAVRPTGLRRLALALALCHLGSVAWAAPDNATPQTPPENGLWLGTVGTHRVMACLNWPARAADTATASNPASSQAASRYAYLRYGTAIALNRSAAQPQVWTEGNPAKPSGTWTVTTAADHISGTWAHPTKNTSPLPVALTRFKRLTDQATDCGWLDDSVAHYRAALDEPVAIGKTQNFGGSAYWPTSLAEGHVTSIQLAGSSAVIQDINQRLTNELIDRAADFYACPVAGQTYVKGKSKEQPSYDASTRVTFWNARWLSLQTDSGGDCGGAHPFSDAFYTTLDLLSGRSINLWQWVKGSRKPDATPADDAYFFNHAAPPKLNALITRQALRQRRAQGGGDDDDCREVIQDNQQYDIRPDTDGWVFTPRFAHVVQACTEDALVTYAELQPWLTPQGKEATASMQPPRQK